MEYHIELRRPTKKDQELAQSSFSKLDKMLSKIHGEHAEIEIEESHEVVRLPLNALKILSEVLKAMAQGNPISIIPVKSELTTQAAADLLGCSRPHVVKLLENGTIPFTKVGRHRRILYDDVLAYRKSLKAAQRQALIELMSNDEENGLYDS